MRKKGCATKTHLCNSECRDISFSCMWNGNESDRANVWLWLYEWRKKLQSIILYLKVVKVSNKNKFYEDFFTPFFYHYSNKVSYFLIVILNILFVFLVLKVVNYKNI